MSDSFYLQLLTNYCVKLDRSVAIFCSPGASPPPSIFMNVSFLSSGCRLLLVWVGIFGLVVFSSGVVASSALGLRPFTLLSDRMFLRLSIRFSRLAVGIQLSLCTLKAAKYTLKPIKFPFKQLPKVSNFVACIKDYPREIKDPNNPIPNHSSRKIANRCIAIRSYPPKIANATSYV